MSYNKVCNQQALNVQRIDQYEDKTSNTMNNNNNTSSSSSSSSSLKRKGKIELYSKKSSKQRKTSSRTSEMGNVMSIIDDPRSPHQVQKNVECVIRTWGCVAPVCPEHFLKQLLSSRGYCHDYINALDHRINPIPSSVQLKSYDNDLVWAIRNSDLSSLMQLCQKGKSMSACNQYSESIVHMACRRAELDVVEFVLQNGGDITIIDDFGRTPLHDAFWRIEPRFDIVTMILDKNLDLLRYADKRGCIPIKYVREEHWIHWCAYFYYQREKYWPKLIAPDLSGHITYNSELTTKNITNGDNCSDNTSDQSSSQSECSSLNSSRSSSAEPDASRSK